MVPLVDIVLVLLIIFMVTATLMQPPSLGVHLPKAKTTSSHPASPLNIVLMENGTISVNGVPTDESDLQRLFYEKAPGKPHVIISGDQNVAHGKVIHVIDLARQAGLSQFAFVVEQEAP